MTPTTDDETILVFSDVPHRCPSPDEFSSANRRNLKRLVIWVADGSEERWQFIVGHWRAVRHWKKKL